MDPRKKTSRGKKSTSLPKEFVDNVTDLFAKTFKKELKGRTIIVEGRIYPDEILLSVGFKESETTLRQTNFEASIDHANQHVIKKLGICVDAISSMMEQYLSAGEDLDLPRAWTSFPFDRETIYLQSSGRNSALEAEANKMLGHERGDELIIAPDEDPENFAGKEYEVANALRNVGDDEEDFPEEEETEEGEETKEEDQQKKH